MGIFPSLCKRQVVLTKKVFSLVLLLGLIVQPIAPSLFMSGFFISKAQAADESTAAASVDEEDVVDQAEEVEAESVEEVAPTEEEVTTPEAPTEEVVVPESETPEVATEEKTEEAAPVVEEVAVWQTEGDKAVTTGPVELGVKYEAPQNKEVTVTFTKLPSTSGTLAIEEITLTKEQIAATGSLSDKAYDITSSMENGSFEYELTLPIPEGKENVQVLYAEKVEDLNEAQIVKAEDVKTEGESIKVELDHFTVFTLTAPDSALLGVCPGVMTDYNVIMGGPGTDTLNGTPGNDYIDAGAGTNIINGNGGNDCILGGGSTDTITTLDGNDVIDAGAGTNNINAGAGNNVIKGGGSSDTITTLGGDDKIDAGSGTNIINAGDGNNVIYGGGSSDTITTGNGIDRVYAGSGTNNIQVNGGNDFVEGGASTDNIDGGIGFDVCIPGFGSNAVTNCESSNPADFAVPLTPELNAENFNTVDDNYKGISVGFNAKNFGTVTAVTVDITRADGSHVVKTGNQGVFDIISGATTSQQLTAPFVIQEGTFTEASDTFYWDPAPAVWNTNTKPVSVLISVTDENGTKTVTNNFFSEGVPSWPTYESLLPVPTVNTTCPAINTVHSEDFSSWNLSQTRATGHNELVANGLRVWTEGATSTDKAAGYYTTNFALADAGTLDIAFTSSTGGKPSLQLGIDKDNNGSRDAYLVYEPWAYGVGNYWATAYLGVPAGMGYQSFGTLNDYLAANPSARIVQIGYSLGSGVLGDAVISKLTAGCTEYTFNAAPPVAPTVTIVDPSPAEGSFVRGTITGHAIATDDEGMGSYYLRFWKDAFEIAGGGTLVHGCQSAPGAGLLGTSQDVSCTYDTTLNPDGTYVFSAQFQDSDILWGQALRTFTVDNTKPTVSIKTGTGVNDGSMGSGGIYSRISFKLNDPNGGLSAVVLNGNSYARTNEWNDLNWQNINQAHLIEGVNTIYTVDRAGNQSNPLTFIFDKTAPTITVKAGFVGNDILKIFSNVSFKLYDANKVDKYVLNGWTSDFTNNTYSDANFANMLSHLIEGENTITLYDVAGNSTSYTFTYDSSAPQMPVHESPVDNASINYNTFTFQWTDVTDAVEYEFQSSQNPAVDGNGVLTTGVWNNKLHGAPDRNNLTASEIPSYGANNTWYWQVRAKDAAGNWSVWTTPWKLTIDMVAPVAPTALTVNEAGGDSVANGGFTNSYGIVVNWDVVADAVGYEYRYWNSIAGDAYNAPNYYVVPQAGTSRAGDFTQGEGLHHLQVRAKDAAGNWSAWSTQFDVTYDQTNPSSIITTFGLPNGGTVETPTWDGVVAGTAADNLSGVSRVDLEITHTPFGGGTPVVTNATAVGTTNWSYDLGDPAEGTYQVVSHAVDNAGNVESTYTITIVYDKTIPEVNLTIDPSNPNGDSNWYVTEPVITLAANDNYNVDYIEYQLNGTGGAWTTYTGPVTIADGTWQFYYRSVDTVGNVSGIGLKNVKVDTIDPDEVNGLDAEYREQQDDIKLDWNIDDNDIDKVYIYRGGSRDFDINSENRKAINDANDETYSHNNPTFGATYYYKLVSVDEAGNRSGARVIKVEMPAAAGGTATVTDEGTDAAGGGEVLGVETADNAGGNSEDGGTVTEEGSVLGATDENGDTNGIMDFIKKYSWWWLIILLIIGYTSYRYYVAKKENQNPLV